LAGLFHHVVALDADQERLREAEARARAHSGVRLAVLSVASPVLRDPVLAQAFNLVLSMQVLGHVGVDACPVALGNFRHLLAPGGTLVLGVPYVNGPHDETWVAKLGPTGHFDSYQASLAEFDDLARQPREGLLPVRHFSIPSVRRMLAREGFRVVRDAPYNWFSATRADLLVLAQRA
jgi:SAM-dependent methyltransferase